jgi:hypothetical protein
MKTTTQRAPESGYESWTCTVTPGDEDLVMTGITALECPSTISLRFSIWEARALMYAISFWLSWAQHTLVTYTNSDNTRRHKFSHDELRELGKRVRAATSAASSFTNEEVQWLVSAFQLSRPSFEEETAFGKSNHLYQRLLELVKPDAGVSLMANLEVARREGQ